MATKNEDFKQDEPSVNLKSSPIKQPCFSKSFSCVHLHRKMGLLYIYTPTKEKYSGKAHAIFLFNPFSKFPAHRNHRFYMIPRNRWGVLYSIAMRQHFYRDTHPTRWGVHRAKTFSVSHCSLLHWNFQTSTQVFLCRKKKTQTVNSSYSKQLEVFCTTFPTKKLIAVSFNCYTTQRANAVCSYLK